MHRKPSGQQITLEISTEEKGVTAKVHKTELVGSKENIELLIAKGFTESVAHKGWLYWEKDSLTKCKENDFDFRATSSGDVVYIELMEFAPLDLCRARYESAPNEYDIYEMGCYLFSKIEAKSNKYTKDARIILLVYSTDWKFRLSVQLHCLMQFFCATRTHVFESIFFYSPSAIDVGSTEAFYPVARQDWRDFEPEAYKGCKAIAVPMENVVVGKS